MVGYDPHQIPYDSAPAAGWPMSRKSVGGSGRPTIRDVAQRAGVSSTAVSLTLNNRPGVSEATKERILAAAKEIGWTPNLAAQALSGHGLHTIGLTLARPASMLGREPFYMDFIAGAESVLAEHGCSLLLRLTRTVEEEITVQREWWQGGRVNGSILVDLRVDDPRVAALRELDLPAVVVAHPDLAGGFPSVWTDDAAAMQEAVRYLGALGHRRLARVSGPAQLGHTVIRGQAFDEACRELGLDASRTLAADYSAEDGARATRSLLMSPDRPTAIVYDNDVMAVAGLGVADEFGLSVPRDLSLLAWDDSELCRLARPALSAMGHDVFALGADVARTLFALLGGEAPPSHVAAAPVLLPRGTTSAPRP